MGNPIFKFVLSHAQYGTQVISEPAGWKDMKIKMERHPDFHSLVEYFESDLVFYGENNIQNGGADFIRSVDSLYGLDAPITFTVTADIDGDGVFEETIFTGQLDCSTIQEFHDNKIKAAIIRTDMWAKFIARKGTPVNLRSTTDLDGNNVPIIDHIDLDLTSQKVRQKYEGHSQNDDTVSYTIPDNEYGQIDFPFVTLMEIREKFTLPRSLNSTRPAELFAVEYGGTYAFDIQIFTRTPSYSNTDSNLDVRLQINDNTAITLTKSHNGIPSIDGYTRHYYTGSLSLSKGDFIRLYFFNNNAVGSSYTFDWLGTNAADSLGTRPGFDSYLKITADTVFPTTIAQGYFAHDALAAILQRIT